MIHLHLKQVHAAGPTACLKTAVSNAPSAHALDGLADLSLCPHTDQRAERYAEMTLYPETGSAVSADRPGCSRFM